MAEKMLQKYGEQAYLLTFAAVIQGILKCTGIILVVN